MVQVANYRLPHRCESAEIAWKLAVLTPRQRQALRSYVWQVERGQMPLSEWLGSACPIEGPMWGALMERCEFRAALEAYEQAAAA